MTEAPQQRARLTPEQRRAQIEALKASRELAEPVAPVSIDIAPVDETDRLHKRRSTLGKIWATGLTTTSIFSITAALGISAQNASADESDAAGDTGAPTPTSDPTAPRLVLDMATGQLITYVNDVAVSAQQVLAAPTTVAASIAVGSPTTLPDLSGFASPASASTVPTAAPSRSATQSPTATTSPIVVPVATPAPVTVAPVNAAPVTAAPVTAAPITAAPVTAAPVTAAPVTAAPITAAPITAAPVTPPPTAAPTVPPTAPPTTQAPSSGSKKP